MKFSIITPTLQRDSLVACCQSVDSQTYSDWKHIVFVDAERFNEERTDALENSQRVFLCYGRRHNNFGNKPRHLAWEYAEGEYVVYLDDDNTFFHPKALADVAASLDGAGRPDWAIFPIMRFGQRFCSSTPGVCHTDSANMVIRREIARWPDINDYTADGILAAQLREKYPFVVFDSVAPIINVPVQGKGL